MPLPRPHRSLITCALACALSVGCGDGSPNQPPVNDIYGGDRIEADGISPLACTPNRDGMITADEMAPAIGVPAHYSVATDISVDSTGSSGAWDWSWSTEGEAPLQVSAAALDGQWFAGHFPSGTLVVPVDTTGLVQGVYSHDDDGFWLHGLASTEETPPEGQTLMVYDAPVLLYRFPLQAGDSWVSVGEVRNGLFRSLPYAGRDTYEVEIDGQGELTLPDLTFSPVLRVRTHVTVQPAVGQSTSQRQISFLFECFGEVSRATSAPEESNPAFTAAAEVRRLAL